MSKTYQQWLQWIENCHPNEIDLGLDRCKQTLTHLLENDLECTIITVAGTNGKGSTVAVLESLARQSNKSSLVFTSPHLLSYRERLKYNGAVLSYQQHLELFEAIDKARGENYLTYFEFSTLSAFKAAEILKPDVLILETGLGGRLDAVNSLAADIAIITTVDYDHQDWLGDDLVSIAREKAGIIHSNTLAIIADAAFPQLIIEEIRKTTSRLYLANSDFEQGISGDKWYWKYLQYHWQFAHLTFPYSNASAAILAWMHYLDSLNSCEQISYDQTSKALANLQLTGRFETVSTDPLVILDVAHNPQAFKVQQSMLQDANFNGKTHLVFGMLSDKNTTECLSIVSHNVDYFYFCELNTARGIAANELKNIFSHSENESNKLQCYKSPADAFKSALGRAKINDRILVTGSFYTVAGVLEYMNHLKSKL